MRIALAARRVLRPLTPSCRSLKPAIAAAMSSSGKDGDLPAFPFARPSDDRSQPPREFADLRSRCPVSKAKLFDGSEASRA